MWTHTHTHTHTHTPPTKTCVASVLPARKEAPPSPERGLCEAHVRAKGIDEHERDETDKRVYVVADEVKLSEEGQPVNQTSL